MKPFYPIFLSLLCCHTNGTQSVIIQRPPSIERIISGEREEVTEAKVEVPEQEKVDASVNTKPAKQNILLIGDSEVVYSEMYFRRAKVKQSNETVFFDSKPGTTIEWWNGNNRFKNEFARYRNIDFIIIFLGTNNWRSTSLPSHQNILNEVAAHKIKCLWVGPVKRYGKSTKINQLLKPAIEQSGICSYFDTEEADIELFDGIHPTQPATIKWLNAIWKMKSSM